MVNKGQDGHRLAAGVRSGWRAREMVKDGPREKRRIKEVREERWMEAAGENSGRKRGQRWSETVTGQGLGSGVDMGTRVAER